MGKKWTIKPTSIELKDIYITEEGYKALRDKFNQLIKVDRPKIAHEVGVAAAHGDRSENAEYIYGKKKLREIDRQIYVLQKKFEVFKVVESKDFPTDKVGFGSRVRIIDEDENERVVQIVGDDEINLNEGKISLKSPLAKAVWQKKVGDICLFHPPKGEMEVEILEIF